MFLGCSCLACAGEVPAPPPAPRLSTAPAGIIPADLDLVLRLDLERWREIVGTEPELQLWRALQVLGVVTAGERLEQHEFWSLVASRASRLYLGCRPTPEGCPDFVAVGVGERLDLGQGFQGAVDLGAGWQRREFATSGPRRQVAQIYLKVPGKVVAVSTAEIDAVARVVEKGASGTTLSPADRGLISLVGRPVSIARWWRARSSRAASWLAEAERVELELDLVSLRAELSIVLLYGTRERASLAHRAVEQLLGPLGDGDAGPGVRTPAMAECLDSRLVIRLRVDPSQLGELARTPESAR